MLRAIREIKPRWVVGENVYGLVNWNGGLVFHEVQADLEAQGYEVQPYLLPAVSVNAPHRRDRIWFVAKNTISDGCLCGESKEKRAEIWEQRDTCTGSIDRIHLSKGSSSNPNNTRTDIGMPSEREWQESNGFGGLAQPELGQTCRDGDVTNPNSNGQHISNSQHEINASEGGVDAQRYSEHSNGDGDATNTEYKGLEGQHRKRNRCTKYRCDKGVFIRSENQFIANWSRFPTVKPTIRYGDDGFPDRLDSITFSKWRNESIKAGGNAVVPQIVYQIFKTIEQYEHQA